MHSSTFDYLKPSDDQLAAMAKLRAAYQALMNALEAVPTGRYEALAITALEQSAMWAMKGLTRKDDGSPRR